MAYLNKEQQRAYVRQHYLDNKEAYKKRAILYKAKTTALNNQYILHYLLEHPCLDCGEADPVVLEFDHRDEKLFNISDAPNKGYSLNTIKQEIAKCDVRCANCHRRKTYKQRNFTNKNITG